MRFNGLIDYHLAICMELMPERCTGHKLFNSKTAFNVWTENIILVD
jgi:hypothetical protein